MGYRLIADHLPQMRCLRILNLTTIHYPKEDDSFQLDMIYLLEQLRRFPTLHLYLRIPNEIRTHSSPYIQELLQTISSQCDDEIIR